MRRLDSGELPKLLYKFRDCRANGHMDILTKSTIYFASPSNFNDIFDCKIPIVDGSSHEEHYERLLHKLMHQQKLDQIDYFDKYDLFNSINLKGKLIMSKFSTPFKKTSINEFYEAYLDISTGVLSLTSNHENILMWGHYAAEHSGFCIGFSTKHLLKLNAHYIGKVRYSKKYSSIYPNVDDDKNIINMFFVKSQNWKYENEYRIIWKDIESRIVKIDKKAIQEIYLGYRIGHFKNLFLKLKAKLLPHVNIYEAEKDDEEFKLRFKKI
jgi:hypothetical protein